MPRTKRNKNSEKVLTADEFPHACQELGEATGSERHSNDDVGLIIQIIHIMRVIRIQRCRYPHIVDFEHVGEIEIEIEIEDGGEWGGVDAKRGKSTEGEIMKMCKQNVS